MQGYIIFTDIEKYSTLEDEDLKLFHSELTPIIFEKLKKFQDKALFWNTWGDAIVAVYDNPEIAINMMLTYRNAFRELNFLKHGIKKLRPRIAANFGDFDVIFDPALGKDNVHGTTVNQTARIEPVTTPGEIFVSKTFRLKTVNNYEEYKDFCRFDDMGEVTLPKKAGKIHVYRLCMLSEEKMKPVGNATATTYYVPVTSDEEKKRMAEEELKEAEKLRQQEEEKRIQEEKLLKLKKMINKANKEVNAENKESYENIKKKVDTATAEKKTSAPKNEFMKKPVFIATLLFTGVLLANTLLQIDIVRLCLNYIIYFIDVFIYLINLYILLPLSNNSFSIPMIPDSLNTLNHLSGAISAFLVSLFLSIQVMRFNKNAFNFKEILKITGLFTAMKFFLDILFCFSVPLNMSVLMTTAFFFLLGVSTGVKKYKNALQE